MQGYQEKRCCIETNYCIASSNLRQRAMHDLYATDMICMYVMMLLHETTRTSEDGDEDERAYTDACEDEDEDGEASQVTKW